MCKRCCERQDNTYVHCMWVLTCRSRHHPRPGIPPKGQIASSALALQNSRSQHKHVTKVSLCFHTVLLYCVPSARTCLTLTFHGCIVENCGWQCFGFPTTATYSSQTTPPAPAFPTAYVSQRYVVLEQKRMCTLPVLAACGARLSRYLPGARRHTVSVAAAALGMHTSHLGIGRVLRQSTTDSCLCESVTEPLQCTLFKMSLDHTAGQAEPEALPHLTKSCVAWQKELHAFFKYVRKVILKLFSMA